MTKNKSNYKDLEYKYRLFSDLMEHVPDVIYFKDKKGKLVMVNHAHAKGLGLRPEQVVGKTDFDFFPKKRAELMTKDDMHVMKTGKPIVDKIETATRPDGIANYVSTTKIPRYDEKGNIIGLIGITRDITHRMQLENLRQEKERIQKKLDALEELSSLKSEFVSVVSHELRTPLAIIKEAVMLIFEGIAGPITDKQKELLIKAKENAKRLNGIIEELLDISRIERGQLRLHFSLVNLNDLLRDSSEFFKKSAEQKGIHLEYILPKDEANIFIDADRISQVISNLINNAIKFTEQNGEINVQVEILENKLRIAVIDTGIGISKEDLSNLFKKFVQLSRIKAAERKGVGLGLSIAKELVDRHGGEMWVESKLGVGSEFYFTLPRFYTDKALDKEIRNNINSLLQKGTNVYLVNLLTVNFKEFKRKVNVDPKMLFKDLEEIINLVINEFSRKDKKSPQIALKDYQSGEWSILFPESSEKEIDSACNILRQGIVEYFKDNKIEGVFINFGILPYSVSHKNHSEVKHINADVYIKRIIIGAEIRRFKRIDYKTLVEVLFSKNRSESSQTVDISEGGLCFISERPLKTDEKIKVRFGLGKKKEHFDLKARVAWRKDIEKRLGIDALAKYKVGLEFIELKDQDKKRLASLIKPMK